MASLALPMAWKKFPMTIWLPMSGKARMTIFRPPAARLINCASSVNRAAMPWEKNMQARKPAVVNAVPVITPYFRVSSTRSGFMAP